MNDNQIIKVSFTNCNTAVEIKQARFYARREIFARLSEIVQLDAHYSIALKTRENPATVATEMYLEVCRTVEHPRELIMFQQRFATRDEELTHAIERAEQAEERAKKAADRRESEVWRQVEQMTFWQRLKYLFSKKFARKNSEVK